MTALSRPSCDAAPPNNDAAHLATAIASSGEGATHDRADLVYGSSAVRAFHPMVSPMTIGRWSDLAPSLASGESVQRFDWLRRLIWPPPSTHLCRAEPLTRALWLRSPQDLHPMVFVGTIGR